ARLCVVRAEGGTPRTLLPDASSAVWSPDGRRIACVRERDLWIVAPDGSAARSLGIPAGTSAVNSAKFPAWSPDGHRLAFVYARFGLPTAAAPPPARAASR
ncbi:MAG TPA: DPP IV N-terminal domain-containing protein, partial [Armatimonadota bacterium]|nr:DPP IV N-terminal domain-containing protein [Armatimonadota bacterium]